MMGQKEAEDFLVSMLGHDRVEEIKEEKEADRIQMIADAQIFFDVFGVGRGPEMLELLKHKTIYLSSMDRGGCIIDGDIPLNPGEFMAGREMQNALIRWIERMVRLSQEKD